MSRKPEYEHIWWTTTILAMAVLAANLYYYCRQLVPFNDATGIVDSFILILHRSKVFASPYPTKGLAAIMMAFCTLMRGGRTRQCNYLYVAIAFVISSALYLFPYVEPHYYLVCTLVGFYGMIWSFVMASSCFSRFHEAVNDDSETFDQCREKIETGESMNLPTRFKYLGKWHDGWINVVNPFRATIVMGLPGSGKSFSVFNPFIESFIKKGYTMFMYDFKFPTLTRIVYNELMDDSSGYSVPPEFFVLNFNDPQRSNRCNPLNPEFIFDVSDASEIADIVMQNSNKGKSKNSGDFFDKSAKELLSACIWYLKTYKGGRYCTFPHVIELMSQDTNKLLHIMYRERRLGSKLAMFIDAMEQDAQDQLQGQLASARVALSDFSSPKFYWTLSGNDFNLDINNPEAPKVLCVGNDPERLRIYGTTIALYTTKMFRLINQPGKAPCAVMLDELPTFYVKDLDVIINTARSNRVAVVLGAQDKSQIIRDYSREEADVILGTVGNHIIGAVNGETAKYYSDSFGKVYKRQESQTRGSDSESINISFHMEELLSVRAIQGLSSGYFCGKVVDTDENNIEKKFFCGKIMIDVKAWKKKSKRARPLPIVADFGLEEVHKKLQNPEIAKRYIVSYLSEEIRRKWLKEDIIMDEKTLEDIDCEALVRYNNLSETDKDKLMKKIIPIAEQEHIDTCLEENYMKIKDEVSRIIDSEYARC